MAAGCLSASQASALKERQSISISPFGSLDVCGQGELSSYFYCLQQQAFKKYAKTPVMAGVSGLQKAGNGLQ